MHFLFSSPSDCSTCQTGKGDTDRAGAGRSAFSRVVPLRCYLLGLALRLYSRGGRADLKGMSLRGGEVTSDFKYLANNEISASSRRSEMGAVGRDSIM